MVIPLMKVAVPKAPIHAHRGNKEWGEDPESWEQMLFGN